MREDAFAFLKVEAACFCEEGRLDVEVEEVEVGEHADDAGDEGVVDVLAAACAGDEVQHGAGDAGLRLRVLEEAVVEDGEAGRPDPLRARPLHAVAAVEGDAQVADEADAAAVKPPARVNGREEVFV